MNEERRKKIQEELKARMLSSRPTPVLSPPPEKPSEKIIQTYHSHEDKPKEKKKSFSQEVTFSCGHKHPIKRLSGNPCPSCQEKQRREERKQVQERRKLKKREYLSPWQRELAWRLGRLPRGSYHDRLFWDGEKWSGTLVVPTLEIGGTVPLLFYGEAPNEIKLINVLDQKWRDWLLEHGKRESAEEMIFSNTTESIR